MKKKYFNTQYIRKYIELSDPKKEKKNQCAEEKHLTKIALFDFAIQVRSLQSIYVSLQSENYSQQ